MAHLVYHQVSRQVFYIFRRYGNLIFVTMINNVRLMMKMKFSDTNDVVTSIFEVPSLET